jgi:hypothetical protein
MYRNPDLCFKPQCVDRAILFPALPIPFPPASRGSAFDRPGANILVVLSSNKTHGLTRFCAAFFGVAIIGCGAPVFCVIVKTSLYAARACSGRVAFFIGAVFPYLVRYLMHPDPGPR